ncbi:MAG: hypothetical protein P8L32_00540, partial [Paracoccaceae bacterium]|nr:hypothetical protein [Paracoccaceae bacterium]
KDLRQHFQRLISLRKTSSSLTGHEIEIVYAEGRSLAYSRGPDTLVLINANSKSWKFKSDVYNSSNWEVAFRSHDKNQGFHLFPMSTTVLTKERSKVSEF